MNLLFDHLAFLGTLFMMQLEIAHKNFSRIKNCSKLSTFNGSKKAGREIVGKCSLLSTSYTQRLPTLKKPLFLLQFFATLRRLPYGHSGTQNLHPELGGRLPLQVIQVTGSQWYNVTFAYALFIKEAH